MANARQYADWLVNNQDKRDTPEFQSVARAYAVAKSQLQKVETKSAADYPPTEGGLSDVAAGLGKTVAGLGRGTRQLLGIGDQAALQSTIDESRRLDAPLSRSAGGFAGQMIGQVGAAMAPGAALTRLGAISPALPALGTRLLSAPPTLGSAMTQAGQGAVLGGLQDVATGESRGRNVSLGAVAGAGVPLIGIGAGAIKAGAQPLYSGGRDVIAGRAMRRVAGENVDDVIRNLERSRALIPGSQPTAAEVAGSPGIAALQRAAAAVDPEAYGIRVAQQNEARVGALQGLAGTGGRLTAAEQARGAATGPMYKAAVEETIAPELAASMKPQIDNLLSRPSMGKAVNRAKEIFGEESIVLSGGGSVRGLQYTKQALDDIIEKASSPASSIGKNELRALQQTRGDLISVLEELSPKLRQADVAYANLSRPINQMQIAEELSKRSTNPLTGNLQPQAFARNLNDDLAASVTGRSAATLKSTMDPQQIGLLGNIRSDLARSVAARDLGRGAGSDTMQKLSMTNVMEQSGVPLGLLNLPGVGRAGNWVYQNTDDLIKQRLAQGLLNPQEAAKLMREAAVNPNSAAALDYLRRVSAPGLLGGSFSLNSTQQ